MSKKGRVVIVGAGQAGARSAFSLRNLGFEGAISLVGSENHIPYERPPLSKEVLLGSKNSASLKVFDEKFYEDHRIDLSVSSTVKEVDVAARRICLTDGSHLEFSKLLIATGARARTIELNRISPDRVMILRTIDDAIRLKSHLYPGQRIAIVGGGFIGLEVAASASRCGCNVHVLEAGERLMGRAASPHMASFLATLHQRNGVVLKMPCTINRVTQATTGIHIDLNDGSCIDVDAIVVGIGAIPNSELAQQAGISCSNGVNVDGWCRTSAPHVFAAGDVTNQFIPILEQRCRLESWDNAETQAMVSAKAILASWNDDSGKSGIDFDCAEMSSWIPWFWTDQFDSNCQMLGSAFGADKSIVRGDPQSNSFIVFHLKRNYISGIELINCGKERRIAKELMRLKMPFSDFDLGDICVPLKDLANRVI